MPRVRFAPSPTGFLHLGHAFSFEFTKRFADGDEILLRIEDIDSGRSRDEYVESIPEDMASLGHKWQQYPLFQSKRMRDYQIALDSLIANGFAYPCFCSRKDILLEIESAGGAPHGLSGLAYPGTCRNLDKNSVTDRTASGDEHSFRLNVETCRTNFGNLSWQDHFRGIQNASTPPLTDPVIARRDIPTSYHLSVVLDDAFQGIELVTRGHDIFSSTHIHRLLQECLSLPTPTYAHHAMVLGEDGQPLTKRNNALPVRNLLQSGLSPAQVIDLALQKLDFPSLSW